MSESDAHKRPVSIEFRRAVGLSAGLIELGWG